MFRVREKRIENLYYDQSFSIQNSEKRNFTRSDVLEKNEQKENKRITFQQDLSGFQNLKGLKPKTQTSN